MAIVETILATLAALGFKDVPSFINSLVDLFYKMSLAIFIIVAYVQISTTDNFSDAVVNKIFGYPTCTATVFDQEFCFFPSKASFDNILKPLFTNYSSLFKLDLVTFMSSFLQTVVLSFLSLLILIRAIIGVLALSYMAKIMQGFANFVRGGVQYN